MTEEIKKDRRLRIMWSSNAPWAPSGYSVQTRDLLYRFLADGWQVACSAFYGLEGGFININGLPCFPKIGEPYGADALLLHSREFGAHVAMTFQDIWPMGANELFTCAAERKLIAYVPIDWFPVPDPILERLKKCYRVISFSQAGKKALEEKGVLSTLIPEAVDTNTFKPMDKEAVRKELGIPLDAFVFGMIAANKDDPPRKSFQHVMDAFVMFLKDHPNSFLFMQTLLEQQGGFNIKVYAQHLGIFNKILSIDPYTYLYKAHHEFIAKLINSFDCLLSPSNSEGFGLPIIEAQSCGIPVIVNNWASMPELIIEGKTGFICDTGYKVWTPIHSFKALPDLNSLHECMEKVFKADRKQMAIDCREHIVKNYDMEDRVKNTWIPFLIQLQNEILGA